MCFAGSVLWALTSESFFICHCLIPWHYDYCNFVCDKALQQVRLYVRNSCPQQSALRDRSVMGFIMFTHTLCSSAFPPSSWLGVLFVLLPVAFGPWGGVLVFDFLLWPWLWNTLSYQEAVRWYFKKPWMLGERMAGNRTCALTIPLEKTLPLRVRKNLLHP